MSPQGASSLGQFQTEMTARSLFMVGSVRVWMCLQVLYRSFVRPVLSLTELPIFQRPAKSSACRKGTSTFLEKSNILGAVE